MTLSPSTASDRDVRLQVAQAIAIRRQRQLAANTSIGIVSPEGKLLRVWKLDGDEYAKVDESPLIEIPEAFEPILLKNKQFKLMVGGRGSGKSESSGGLLMASAKDKNYKIGCFREMQNSIEDSVHALLSDKIEDIGFPGFTITDKAIRYDKGAEFKFKGLSRNPDAVKSMHGFKRFWIEEGQSVSGKSLTKLLPTLRGDDVELWITMNPESSADPIYQRFVKPFERELLRDGYYEDDLHIIIVCNYDQNPWFPDNLEAQRLHDKKNLTNAEYEHIWEGKTLDTVDRAIISTEMFDACIDAHEKLGFKPQGIKVVAHDPSDEGDDPKGLAVRVGSVFTKIADMDYGKVEEGCEWSLTEAIDGRADVYTWDCDGMGVALRMQVSNSLAGKRIDWKMFKGSEGVKNPNEVYQGKDLPLGTSRDQRRTNKQTFKNHRSQAAWKVRDRMYNTWRAVTKGEYIDPDEMISIASSGVANMDQLRAEVCRIPLKRNPNGYIQVMSKDEMWNVYQIPSPNLFDSIMMSIAYEPEMKTNTTVHIPRAPTY